MLAHKVQVLLDEEQHSALMAAAKAQGKSLSALLREAVVEGLLREARCAARKRACEQIAAMNLPVGDWAEMEEQSARARAAGRRRG